MATSSNDIDALLAYIDEMFAAASVGTPARSPSNPNIARLMEGAVYMDEPTLLFSIGGRADGRFSGVINRRLDDAHPASLSTRTPRVK